jgi:protein SCO1/2
MICFGLNGAGAVPLPDELKSSGVTEHLGAQVIPADYLFNDETGRAVRLSEFFEKGKPVLLTLVYYQCPNLCNFMLNGLVSSLKNLDWSVGDQFEVVSVSIDPKETPDLASRKKEAYLRAYGRSSGTKGWHFLTGSEDQIKKLAAAVGFGYRYVPEEKQYAHSAVIPVLTSHGVISRYLYGIEFLKSDLRLALLEASNGKIGTVVDRLLLFCYRYDPKTRKYSVYLNRVMQLGCGFTVLIFGGYLAVFWRRQRKGAFI